MIREYNELDFNKVNVLGRDLNINFIIKLTPERKCYIYEKNDEILGFITFDILIDRVEIIDFIVHINHRKKGIGSLLLNKAIEVSISNNCKSISLEVKSTNKNAISFYIKNNFKNVSTRKRYYENGSIDAYLLYREL